MNTWYTVSEDKCYICVAGAIIAQRLCILNEDIFPAEYPTAIAKRLFAIDYLRLGNIYSAAKLLGIKVVDVNHPMPDYGDPLWWKRANDLLFYLKVENV